MAMKLIRFSSKLWNDKIFLVLPAIVAGIISLILTSDYYWPLSGDIFFHVHLASLYLESGFTYWDPLTMAPYGRPIFYPPIFHFILSGISYFSHIRILQAARFMQPFLTFLLVLSFSLVAYKLNENLLSGISAGFFIFFSIIFIRFLLPLPENLALILFPWAMYTYYLSIKKNNTKHAIIAGLLVGIILLTHVLSALCLFLILGLYSLVLFYKSVPVGRYFILFLLSMIIIGAIWWLPLLLQYGLIYASQPSFEVYIWQYPIYYGIITIIFAFLGGYHQLKRRKNSDILIIVSLFAILVLSNIFYLGVPVISNRLLTFALFPIVTLAGLGVALMQKYSVLRQINPRIFYIFLIFLYLTASFSAVNMIDNFKPTPTWLRVSSSELEVAEWFKINGDKNRVVVAPNFRDTIIVAIARQPVALGGYGQGITHTLDLQHYAEGKAEYDDYKRDGVGYVVLPLGARAPPYTKLVYKNNDYAIYIFTE